MFRLEYVLFIRLTIPKYPKRCLRSPDSRIVKQLHHKHSNHEVPWGSKNTCRFSSKQFIPGVFFHSFQYPKIHGLENTWQGHRCPAATWGRLASPRLDGLGREPTLEEPRMSPRLNALEVTIFEVSELHQRTINEKRIKVYKSQMLYTNYILPSVPPSHHNRFLLISCHKISIIYLPQCIHFTISLVPSRGLSKRQRKISHLPIILATALQPSHVGCVNKDPLQSLSSVSCISIRVQTFFSWRSWTKLLQVTKKHSVSCAGWKKIKQSSRVTKLLHLARKVTSQDHMKCPLQYAEQPLRCKIHRYLRGSGVTAKSLNGPFQYVEQSLRCKTQWVETCKKLWNVHSNAWLIRDCSEHDPTMSPSVRNLPVRWPCFSFYFSSVF